MLIFERSFFSWCLFIVTIYTFIISMTFAISKFSQFLFVFFLERLSYARSSNNEPQMRPQIIAIVTIAIRANIIHLITSNVISTHPPSQLNIIFFKHYSSLYYVSFMLGLQSHEELSCHSLYSKKTTTPYDKESWLKVISNYEM